MTNKKKKYGSGLLDLNGWAGLCWLIIFIPCFLFFANNELFLRIAPRTNMIVVTQTEIVIPNNDPRLKDTPVPNDGSQMIIITEKRWFIFKIPDFFDNIIEGLSNAEHIEIWYKNNAGIRQIVDIRVNQSSFIVPKTRIAIRLYLIGLIFSGLMLLTGIMVIIKTKGWGSFGLLEKYPEGLLKTLRKRLAEN